MFMAAVLPVGNFALVFTAILHHFSRKRLSNRHGLLSGFILFLSCLSIFGASTYLNIDTDEVHTDYSWCWMDASQMIPLAKARETRYKFYIAIAAVNGVEIAW
jgi:ABC-type cobalamin transport system permease subunit